MAILIGCLRADYESVLKKYLGDQKKKMFPVYQKLVSNLQNQSFKIINVVGTGANGLAFKAIQSTEKNRECVIKISTDKKQKCEELENNHRIISIENPTIIKLYQSFTETIVTDKYSIDFCVFILEAGYQDLGKPIFKPGSPKKENSTILENILFTILKGFIHMNFKRDFLHGDIKPSNIVIVKDQDIDFQPKIIDFDLSFKYRIPPRYKIERREKEKEELGKKEYERNEMLEISQIKEIEDIEEIEKEFKREDGKIDWITYALDYRPPELKLFCPTLNLEEMSNVWYLRYYKYDNEFKEDAFALGVTFKEIIAINKEYISLNYNTNRLNFVTLVIAKHLTEKNINKRSNLVKALEIWQDERNSPIFDINEYFKNKLITMIEKESPNKKTKLPKTDSQYFSQSLYKTPIQNKSRYSVDSIYKNRSSSKKDSQKASSQKLKNRASFNVSSALPTSQIKSSKLKKKTIKQFGNAGSRLIQV